MQWCCVPGSVSQSSPPLPSPDTPSHRRSNHGCAHGDTEPCTAEQEAKRQAQGRQTFAHNRSSRPDTPAWREHVVVTLPVLLSFPWGLYFIESPASKPIDSSACRRAMHQPPSTLPFVRTPAPTHQLQAPSQLPPTYSHAQQTPALPVAFHGSPHVGLGTDTAPLFESFRRTTVGPFPSME